MTNFRNKCPHCDGQLKIRDSDQLHPLMRKVYARCMNEACGFSAIGRFELDYELAPSQMARPSISLPPAPSLHRREAHLTYFKESHSRQIDLVDLLEQA